MNSSSGPTISRQQFLRTTSLAAFGLLVNPRFPFPQESPVTMIKREAAKAPIIDQSLRGSIHVLSGSGGNISVFSGPDGKLLVDAGIAVSKNKILDALSKISGSPIKTLINSHWHFDHTDGNEWLHQSGATIVAHRQTRHNLATTIRVEDWNYTFQPAPQSALPTVLFDTEHTLDFNKTPIQLKKYPPSHTDCDISVYFPHADVLHAADTWWNPYYPFIDHNSGGTLDGMIEACEKNIKMSTAKTLIVPGHGAVGDRNQLIEFRDMLQTVKHNVSRLKKSGMSLQAAVAAKPTAKFDAKWGKFAVDGAFFTRLVYKDV